MTLKDRTVVVVGGSRGLGRGVVEACREAGARVVAVARDVAPLSTVDVEAVAADATDPESARRLLDAYRPDVLVLVAGAVPPGVALLDLTWDDFSANWHADTRIAFEWLGAVLRTRPVPGTRVIVFGSQASLNGSPISGGYAGAKAMVHRLTQYARLESRGPTFTAVLPALAPGTTVGDVAVRGYSARQGIAAEAFVARLAAPLTPAIAGAAVVALSTMDSVADSYLLDGAGIRPLDG
ncbi:short-chain dehydrogenase [Virgisporangium aliadipatigenens]|uniref:Short-chain dehydrogenase n=1 Tax=Virgisporangium aliadipatigenens TaxID=741659 RepID=A0A8J4DUN1_9ACTN|nr:SDR family oxidoreductase [Virgisporangium aliadipatigenens]GIJ49332.1 short-chain dehydrogenase [Virgisporangium aliadipatigenens]